MKQTIEIEVPNGKKAVWKDGKVVFEDIKPPLPKTWEEFCILNPRKTGEYYISSFSKVCKIKGDEFRDYDLNKNVFKSEEVAGQHIALMQLHRLRDCYRQGWKPDCSDNSKKWCILKYDNKYSIVFYYGRIEFLSFQTRETAELFLENFRSLIEQAGDLI